MATRRVPASQKRQPFFSHSLAQVKVLCQFRGREMEFKQIAFDLFNRFIRELEEVNVDSAPSIDGRSMIMMLSPARVDAVKPAGPAKPKSDKPPAAAPLASAAEPPAPPPLVPPPSA